MVPEWSEIRNTTVLFKKLFKKRRCKVEAYKGFWKNAKAIKEVAKEVPLDRLLVETDDPYLTPVPFRGKENRPSYVKYVLKEIAEIKEMNYEELEKIVYENSLRVFHLWKR